MTGSATRTRNPDQAARPEARPVLAPRPRTPPGATQQRRSADDDGNSYAPTSIAVVMTVVLDTTTLDYDVDPEATSIRLGRAGALVLMIDDRALLRLAVLTNEAAAAMRKARGEPVPAHPLTNP